MTNILVPTDFTPATVKIAAGVLTSGHYDKCNLVLFHAFDLPAMPYEFLGSAYRDPSCELMTEAFRQACKQLKDDHSRQINKIIVRCMAGNTRAVFRNFIEANDIDLIYCPEEFRFVPPHPHSIDPFYLFSKCGVPVVKTKTQTKEPSFAPAYFNNMQVSAQ